MSEVDLAVAQAVLGRLRIGPDGLDHEAARREVGVILGVARESSPPG